MDTNKIRLYRGLADKFDINYDKSKTDSPYGYSTWTDNVDLAKQYAGDSGKIYYIDLPHKKLGKTFLDDNPKSPTFGDRHLFYKTNKAAGLNNISGNEYLVYTQHEDYNHNDIKEFPKEEKLTASDFEQNDLTKAIDEDALGQLNGQPEHQEVLDWSRKTIPSNTARTWYLHHYSQNPSIHKDLKSEMEHHGSMMGRNKKINEIKFSKKLGLEDGLKSLQNADKKWQEESIKKHGELIKPSEKTEKMLDLGNGWGWYNLNTDYCDNESRVMGHCGQVNPNSTLLSLRKEIKQGKDVYHQPHVTAEYHPETKTITQIKGKQNTKPDPKYHAAIMPLLESEHVKYKAPSTYRPETDFQLSDLNKENFNRIMDKKPDLDFMSIKDPDRFDKIRKDMGNSVDQDFMGNWSRFLREHKGNIDSALNSDDDILKIHILKKHPELTIKHFEDATHGPNQFLQQAALRNPNFPTDLIDHHIKNNHYLETIAKHPNTTKEQLMKIIMENKMSGDGAVRALTRPEITGDDYTHILRNSQNLTNNMDRLPKAMFNMIKSPEYDKFRPEHVQLGWDYIQPDVVGHAIDIMKEHPETIRQEYFDESLGDKKKKFDYDIKSQMLDLLKENPKYVKPEHIHHGFSHASELVNRKTKDVLLKNPDIIREEYLSHMNPTERFLFDKEMRYANPNLKDWVGRTTDNE